MYGNEKKPSRVFEIYERLFEFKQEDRSISEFMENSKVLLMKVRKEDGGFLGLEFLIL